MRKILWTLFVTLAFMLPSLAWAAGGAKCITCHASDPVMKTMVKPPEIGGEGEG